MDGEFEQHIASLPGSLRKLLSMEPVKLHQLPKDIPQRGVYLLSERGRNLYVGRSNDIKSRLRAHASSSHKKAAFAFRLARKKTGKQPTYKQRGSRDDLMLDKEFSAAFENARQRISKMHIRFVEETHPTRQALLEIYVATTLKTSYNEFDNH